MPVLFASEWSPEKKQWKDSNDTPTDWDAFKLWDEDVRRVNFDRKAGLVTLMIDWKDPALAAKWANELVGHVNSRLRAEAVEEAEKSVAFLEKQLSLTSSVEVQQAIYRLIEAQTKKKMVASTREEYAFQTIDPAVPPQERTSPKRTLIVITGLVLGLALSILIVSLIRWGGSSNEITAGEERQS
jgi:uncharacterized protein involved in exopolysaccharide biosynthesis